MTEPRQLPLDFQHPPAMSRDDFVEAPENEQALSLVDAWPHWPAPVAVLVGPAGSGKTHLLSVFAETAGAVDAGAGFSAALDAAEAGGAVFWDDADRHVPQDDTALFHLINAVRAGGGTLLMAASAFPAGWPVALPDLASRLRAATVVELGTPGDVLLQAVLHKLFADRQMEIDPQVIRFVANRMERSLACAMEIVDRLDRASLERRRPITRALAGEILG